MTDPYAAPTCLMTQLMLERYGVMLGGKNLWRNLGFETAEAFRKAIARQQIPVALFELPHRRGRFALTCEVAAWLMANRQAVRSELPMPLITRREDDRS